MDYFNFMYMFGGLYHELGTLVNLSNNKTPNIALQSISQLNRDNRTGGRNLVIVHGGVRGFGIGMLGGGWGLGGGGGVKLKRGGRGLRVMANPIGNREQCRQKIS
jgi:hypothetical protein